MHLEIVVNHNSNSLRVDEVKRVHSNTVLKKGVTITCERPSNTVRILHEVFNRLTEGGILDPTDINNSISITEINEDSVRNAGEW